MLDAHVCYQAMSARDTRFDGVFFVAVRSTKIYCRPVCRVKLPLFKNCSFYRSAAAAEVAGYRPCLRCRPELAPGYSSMEAASRLASQAKQMIDEGALDRGSIEDLAEDFGVSARHLRRVIQSEFGVSPVELAQTQRLLLAKRLLTDTNLRITDIAYASGFSSLRRFNSLFKNRYSMVPGQFRKNDRSLTDSPDCVDCDLSFRPPYAWNSMIDFLQPRLLDGVETIQKGVYRRTVCINGVKGTISVFPIQEKNMLRARIDLSLLPVLVNVLASIRKLFDLNAEPISISNHLGRLSAKEPGLRVPGAFDPFEVCLRAILGQQISVKAATTLAARFVKTFGEKFETNYDGLTHFTPSAERIANSNVKKIISLGIPTKRAATVLGFANAVASKKFDLRPETDFQRQIEKLTELPGIGNWTAQYIAMRAFGWPDAFPHTDLGIYKALEEKNPSKVLQIAEGWRPWRSYAAIHLWKSLGNSK